MRLGKMHFDNCIQQVCPPASETFSYRKLPCRFEQPVRSSTGGQPKRECPFRWYCQSSAGALRRLEGVYGPWIKVTLAEPSSSIVVRSEHQYNRQQRHRLTLRKHIYELIRAGAHPDNAPRWAPFRLHQASIRVLKERGVPARVLSKISALQDKTFESAEVFEQELRRTLTATDVSKWGRIIANYASSALGCHDIHPEDRFGEYLGFLDLRFYSVRSPLAMGLLAVPRSLRQQDKGAAIITGNYGPVFGGPSFACTVYSMHDPMTGGAVCAQASVIMALGALTDRGALIRGTYTITYLAKKDKAEMVDATSATLGCRCFQQSEFRPIKAINVEGLNPAEIKNVLSECNVSPSFFTFNPDRHSCRLLVRLIEAYIGARFPIILLVGTRTWWPWDKPNDPGHAVTVVGFRRWGTGFDEVSLVVHDPGYLPFYEKPIWECIDAARAFSDQEKVCLIFVADGRIKRHAYECILDLLQKDDAFVLRNYLEAETGAGYSVRLVRRWDLADILWSRNSGITETRLSILKDRTRKGLEKSLARSRYWCIEVRHEDGRGMIWLFDAETSAKSEGVSWAARIHFTRRSLSINVPNQPGGIETIRID